MEPIIELSNIKKEYKIGTEEIHALSGVSINIYKNEYVALMGPSGSGKSTLMNILGCLDSPTSGEYMLNKLAVAKMTDNELAEVRNKQIGFVFQTFNLLPRSTTLENVMLPLVYAGIEKTKREEMAKKVLEQVGLGNRMSHKPNELSGGQRQRVAIARALVNNPAIILADEPTGNLDRNTADLVFSMMLDLAHSQGTAFVVVTHDIQLASRCDRQLNLVAGSLQD